MAGTIRECGSCGYRVGDSDTSCPRCAHTSFTKRAPPPAPKPVPSPRSVPPAAGGVPPVAARRPVASPPSPVWLGFQVFFFAGIVAGLLGAAIGGLLGTAIGGVISAVTGWIVSLFGWTTWDDYSQVWLRLVWLLSAWITVIVASLRCSRYFIENIASSSSTSGWKLIRDFRFARLIPLAILWVGTLLLFAPNEWTRVTKARSPEARQSSELVKSGEQSLENGGDRWQNISEAVDKFLQAIQLWPENSKAKAELEKSCEKFIMAAEREFYKGNAALARDLFSQARRIAADPEKVNSSEQRLYRFLEVRAPPGSWSQPVPLDQSPAVEFHSEIPIHVSDADSERLIAETPPDPVSFRGTSVRLQSTSGQDCKVGVYFLVASRNSTQDLIRRLNFLAPPSTRATFFVNAPMSDAIELHIAEPVVSGMPAGSLATPNGSPPVAVTKGRLIRIPENITAQWQNISEAVGKIFQAIRLWPENSKAKAELEKSCENLIEAAGREFHKGNAALARDLFSQARRIAADPAKVNSSEQRLYRFIAVQAPHGSWSQPVPLDQCPAVEFHSEIPLYVSDADSERLIVDPPPDPISFRGTSVRLQSTSGQDCQVGVYFLQVSNTGPSDLIRRMNVFDTSSRARFVINPPTSDGWKVLRAIPVVPEPTDTPPPTWPADTAPPNGNSLLADKTKIPIRIPELKNYINRPVVDVWLYGDFSFRGWDGSTGYFNTGFPAAGSTRVEIQFARGIRVSAAIQRQLRNRDSKVRFRVAKSDPIKVLSVQKSRDGYLLVRAISNGALDF